MGKTVLILTLISLTGKISGFLREIMVAYFWGTSYVVDAYLTAGAIHSILFGWLISVSTCYMPVYSEIKVKKSKEAAKRFTGKLVGIVIVTGILAGVFMFLFRDLLVTLTVPGYIEEAHQLTVHFLILSVASVVVIPVSQVLKYYLEANRYFISAACSDIFVSLTQIGIIGISGFYSQKFLGFALIVPYCIQLGVTIIMISYNRISIPLSIGITEDIKKLYILLIPVFASSMLSEINNFIDKIFASQLPTGSVALLNYALTVRDVLLNIFISALLTICYPLLSRMSAEKNIEGINFCMRKISSFVFTVFIPMTTGALLLSDKIITLLYLRGSFLPENVAAVSRIFSLFAIALVPLALTAFILRLCYSLQNTKISLFTGGLTAMLNILLNIIFVRIWKVNGLAAATMLSSWIALFFLIFMVRRSDNGLTFNIEKAELKKTVISTAVMAGGIIISGMLIERSKGLNLIIQFFLQFLFGFLIYIFCMWKMESDILCEVLNKVKKK